MTLYQDWLSLCSMNYNGQHWWTVLGLAIDLVGLLVLVWTASAPIRFFKESLRQTRRKEDLRLKIVDLERQSTVNKQVRERLERDKEAGVSETKQSRSIPQGHSRDEYIWILTESIWKAAHDIGWMEAEISNIDHAKSYDQAKFAEYDFEKFQLAAFIIAFGLCFQIVGALPCL